MRSLLDIILWAFFIFFWTITCLALWTISIFVIYGTGDGGIINNPHISFFWLFAIVYFALWIFGFYIVFKWYSKDKKD